jgi:tetratricopeptide (TPR) repeat protein
VRHGLLRPARVVRRLLLFEFRQLATARVLARLGAAGVRPREIRESLERLGAWLPDREGGEAALAQLEALGRQLVVRTSEGLAEPDGQLRLGFEEAHGPGHPSGAGGGAAALGPGREWGTSTAPAREHPASAPRHPWRGSAGRAALAPALEQSGASAGRAPPAPALAPDWFELGAEAEEAGRFEEAVEAYARAVRADPDRPEVRFNLANALYALERKADAVQALLAAVELDSEYVEAWNNLGNIMADVGEVDEACACFARALELEPCYADAHYNLAEVLANEGRYGPAREHWRAYLASDPMSPTADAVRERLARTAGSSAG